MLCFAAVALGAPSGAGERARPARWTVIPLANGETVIGVNPAGAWTSGGQVIGYDGRATRLQGAGLDNPRLFPLPDGVLVADGEEVKCRGRSEGPCFAGRLRLFSSEGGPLWQTSLRLVSGGGASFTVASMSDRGRVLAGGTLAGCAAAPSDAKSCRDLKLAHKNQMCSDDEDDDTCTQPLVAEYDRNGQFKSWKTFPGTPGQVAIGGHGELGFYGEFLEQLELGAGTRFVSPAKADVHQAFVRVLGRGVRKTWDRALLGKRSIHISRIAFDDDGGVWIVADVAQVSNGQPTAVTLVGRTDDQVLTTEPCRIALVVRLDPDGKYVTHRDTCSRNAGGNVWSTTNVGVVVGGPPFSEWSGMTLMKRPGARPAETRRTSLTWLRQNKPVWSASFEDAAVRGVYADASGWICVALMFDGARELEGSDQPSIVGASGVWTTVAGCVQSPVGS